MAARSPVKSNRGKPLVYDQGGYEYRPYHIDNNGVQLYRCMTEPCSGKAKIINGVVTQYHSHIPPHLPPDHSDEIRTVRKHVKEQRQLGVPTDIVIQNNVLNAPAHLIPLLNIPAMERSAQRSVEVHGMKDWPATIDPTIFTSTFLREDTCANFPKGDCRAYKIFCSDFGLALLRSGLHWCADGTFFAAPHDFVQIFIVGVQEGHLMTPCLYSFLTTKSSASYTHIFEWINAQGVPGPTTLSCDFELGMSAGGLSVFPNLIVYRCAFHLFQAVFRKIETLRLTDLYRAPNTKKYFKSLMALSLIPYNDIPKYFEELKADTLNSIPFVRVQRVEELFDYFENNYVGVKAPNGVRINPLFPPQTWSIYGRVMGNLQIGNSTMESFNSKLQSVPPDSSAQKVAAILFAHDKNYEAKHETASQQQMTLVQAFPQSSRVKSQQVRRRTAVSNGPMGKSEVDHLAALSVYIHIPH